MATQIEIEAAIAAIDAQLNAGIRRAEYQGKGAIERDLAALRLRKSELQAELAALADTGPTVRQFRTYSTKGL